MNRLAFGGREIEGRPRWCSAWVLREVEVALDVTFSRSPPAKLEQAVEVRVVRLHPSLPEQDDRHRPRNSRQLRSFHFRQRLSGFC